MKNLTRNILGGLALLSLAGCARSCDKWDAKGGILGSYKAPYIVVSQSGGRVMDVYKLESAIVQSEENSDGWLFKDQGGRPVFLGGDVKHIRLDSTTDPIWDKYHEYHMEFESKTYRELYGELGQ